MPSLKQSRRLLRGLMIALVALNLVAAAYAFLPQTSKAPRQRYLQLQAEVALRRAQAVPFENIDRKLATAHRQIAAFYGERLPSQPSAVLERVGKLARDHNVALSSVEYDSNRTAVSDLRSVEMKATVHGAYTSVAEFINSLERDPMFFVVTGVRLNGQREGKVTLQLTADAYIKSGGQS